MWWFIYSYLADTELAHLTLMAFHVFSRSFKGMLGIRVSSKIAFGLTTVVSKKVGSVCHFSFLVMSVFHVVLTLSFERYRQIFSHPLSNPQHLV